MTKKKDNKKLLEASKKVMEMAAKRRKRMEKLQAQDDLDAPLPELPTEDEPAVQETVVETAPAVEAEPIPAPEQGAPAAASAKGKKAPVKKNAKAKAATKVEALDQNPPNGGFEGASLSKAPDGSSLGDEEYGYSVPPELAKAIEDGRAEDSADESYQPGVLVPPGLEDAVMAFVDPATLSADAEVRFDMIPFMPEGATTAAEVLNANAHWVLMANGDPLAKISINDQDDADKIAAHFVSLSYAQDVINGIDKHGLKATLDFVKAKPYVAKVDQNAKVEEIRAKLAAESQETLRAAVADVKSRYVENIGLVLAASANNFLVENPLKDGLIEFMTSGGIPEQVAAQGVDNAFFQYGEKTFAGLLDQAEEWSNFTPEALEQVKATLDGAGRRARPLPSERTPAEANPDYDRNLANRMAASAVPVQTPTDTGAHTPVTANVGNPEPASDDDKASFRAKYGRFGS